MSVESKKKLIKVSGIVILIIYLLVVPIIYFNTVHEEEPETRYIAETIDESGMNILLQTFPSLVQIDENSIIKAEASFVELDPYYYYTFFYAKAITDEQFNALQSTFASVGVTEFYRLEKDKVISFRVNSTNPNIDDSSWWKYMGRHKNIHATPVLPKIIFWLLAASVFALLIYIIKILNKRIK